MTDHERSVRRLRRQLLVVLTLKYAVAFATLWAFLWGIVVLVLRAEAGTPREWLLWGLAALPFVVAAAVVRARRRLPQLETLRALMDRQGRCGGLLMAGHEVDVGAWDREMPAWAGTRVRWAGGRSWGMLAAAAAFVALAFWVPERFADAGTANPLEIGEKVDKLAKQIQVLKEETILEPERADALKQKLEQLRDDARAKEPAKTLEALDHLRDVTKNTAKAAAESSMRKTEELAKAETLAEGLRQATPELDAKTLAEGMKELSALVEKIGKETAALDKLADMMKGAPGATLTPEQLKQLAEALRDAKGDIADQLGRLLEIGLIDLETLEKCKKCGECQGEALAELLKMCQGNKSVEEMLGCCMHAAGRGGIDEGGGAVPLTFGPESERDGTKFKEQALPPADLAALKESVLAGVGKTAPKADKPAGPSQSGALRGAAAGAGSANTQTILPQYRKTVEKFFDRPAEPKK